MFIQNSILVCMDHYIHCYLSIFCKVEVLCVSTHLLTTVTGSGDILILVDIKSTSLHKTLGSGMFSHTVWYIAISFGLSSWNVFQRKEIFQQMSNDKIWIMSFDSNAISVFPYDFTIASQIWLSSSKLIITI
jgi:hypothetical protein